MGSRSTTSWSGCRKGTPLVAADDITVAAGERVLVTGPSGAGKSTLFRAIAGIWPFGAGTIVVPKGAKVMALPQRPYFPIGTLAAAVTYPAEPGTFGAEALAEVIGAVGLPALAVRLKEEAHWNRMLSLGEQQRLGIARAILQAPDYLFLDEATASLDEPSEAALYRLLGERLAGTTIVSIGHRSTLAAFHRRGLALVRDGDVHRAARGRAGRQPSSPCYHQRSGQRAPPEQIVPDEGEGREQARPDRHRGEEEAPGHVVDHDDERIDAGRRMKAAGEMHRRHGEADGERRCPGPRSGDLRPPAARPRLATRCPPMSARGCAASISGEPMTSTIEVANGTNISGKAARSDNSSISAMAIAPPAAPAKIPSKLARAILRQGSASSSLNLSSPSRSSQKRRAAARQEPPPADLSRRSALLCRAAARCRRSGRTWRRRRRPRCTSWTETVRIGIGIGVPVKVAFWSLVKTLQSSLTDRCRSSGSRA